MHHHHPHAHHPPGSHGPRGPHHEPHHGHHDRHSFDAFIRALRMMYDHGSLHSVKDIQVIAERVNEKKIALILSGFNPDLRPDIAIDKLDVMLAEEAAAFRADLLAVAAGCHIALIGPVPPHIHELFGEFDGSVVLLPDDGEHVPHHLRWLGAERIIRSIPACRKIVSAADLLIFDVFRNGEYYAAATVVDLVDHRIIRPDARVIAHGRPHKHNEDIALDEATANRVELY